MMHRLLIAALALALAPISALAQSAPNPPLYYGFVPSAAQWNSYFAAKQDVLGYTPLNTLGGTMTGALRITGVPAGATFGNLTMWPGQVPSAPNTGDLWMTTGGLYYSLNSQTIGPLGSATGLVVHTVVRLTSTTPLPNSPAYNNGVAGVGATLTAGSNTTLTVDGVAAAYGDRILVQGQADATQNGAYVLNQVGSASAPWVLIRALDFNAPLAGNAAAGAYFFVTSGSANQNTGWVFTTLVAPITVGTTAITFTQFSSVPAYAAGQGLNLSGVTFSLANSLPSGENLPSPTLSGTVTGTYTLGGVPTVNSPILSGTVTGTYTLGGVPTISSPTISSPTISGTATGTYTLGGAPTINSPTISGTVAGTYTLSNPILSGIATGTYTLGGVPTISSPTISGMLTETGGSSFNGAPSVLNTFIGNGATGYSTIVSQAMTSRVGQNEFLVSLGLTSSTSGGNKVVLYTGMDCQSGSANCWSMNPLINLDPGFNNTAQIIEADFNNNTGSDAAALCSTISNPATCPNALINPYMIGLSISEVGNRASVAAGLNGGKWQMGWTVLGDISSASFYENTNPGSYYGLLLNGSHTYGVYVSSTSASNYFGGPANTGGPLQAGTLGGASAQIGHLTDSTGFAAFGTGGVALVSTGNYAIAADNVSATILHARVGTIYPARIGTTDYETITSTAHTFANNVYFGAGDPWIDIKYEGAFCDGVHDDTGTIQAAINAAQTAGYGIVYFPPNLTCWIPGGLTVTSSFVWLLGGPGNLTMISSARSGSLTSGSTSVTGITTTGLAVGQMVYGTGIPFRTTVTSVGTNIITLSAAATVTGAKNLSFDGQHNLLDLNARQVHADHFLLGGSGIGSAGNTVVFDANCVECVVSYGYITGGQWAIQNKTGDAHLHDVFVSNAYGSAIIESSLGAFYMDRVKADQPAPVAAPAHPFTPMNWAPSTGYSNGNTRTITNGSYTFYAQVSSAGSCTSGTVAPVLQNYGIAIIDGSCTWQLMGSNTYAAIELDSGAAETYINAGDMSGDFTYSTWINGGTLTTFTNTTLGGALQSAIQLTSGNGLVVTSSTLAGCLYSGCAGIYAPGGSTWTGGMTITGNLFQNEDYNMLINNNSKGIVFSANVGSAAINCVQLGSGIGDYLNITNNICYGSAVADFSTVTHKTISGNQ